MDRTLRRASTALAAVVLVTATLVIVAAPAGAATGSDCGTKQFRLLFWPKGHKAIPSVGFPEFLTSHLEVYTGTGKKFPSDQQVGYADPTSSKVSTTTCHPGTGGVSKPSLLTKTTSKATMLVCTFKSSPLVSAAQAVGGGGAILLYVADAASAYAVMKTAGSTLQYDAKACKTQSSPH